jgi:glucokinase
MTRVTDRPLLAIDFGGSKVALALFTASGAIAHHVQIPISQGDTADGVLHEVILHATTLRSQYNDEHRANFGDLVIGAVSPGVVLDDRILLAPNVVGWPDVALARQLAEGLDGCRVFVGNDVKAAAAAEAASGRLAGCNPGLYLNLGTGIAAAMVINGAVIQGANGASGEIGYNSAVSSAAAKSGLLLEEVVGSRALVRRSRELGFWFSEPADVFASAEPACTELIGEFLDEVAIQLQHIVHLVDPQRIVLGGGLIGSSRVIIPGLLVRLCVRTQPEPDIVISAYGAQASLHGARLLALSGHGNDLTGRTS